MRCSPSLWKARAWKDRRLSSSRARVLKGVPDGRRCKKTSGAYNKIHLRPTLTGEDVSNPHKLTKSQEAGNLVEVKVVEAVRFWCRVMVICRQMTPM